MCLIYRCWYLSRLFFFLPSTMHWLTEYGNQVDPLPWAGVLFQYFFAIQVDITNAIVGLVSFIKFFPNTYLKNTNTASLPLTKLK